MKNKTKYKLQFARYNVTFTNYEKPQHAFQVTE